MLQTHIIVSVAVALCAPDDRPDRTGAVKPTKAQRAAIAAIEKFGGSVEFKTHKNGKRYVEVQLCHGARKTSQPWAR